MFVPVLRPGRAGPAAVVDALARVHVRGAGVDWAAVLGGGERVDLPTYAFQRQRFWPRPVQVPAGGGAGAGPGWGVEAGFWAAVEGGDAGGLAAVLGVDAGRPLGEVLPALASWRRRERDRSVTSGWRYRVCWVPVPVPEPAVLAGTWLVVVPAGLAGELAGGCVRALAAGGARVVVIEAGAGAGRGVLAACAGAVARAVAGGVAGVVSLLALDEGPAAGFPVVPGGLAGSVGLVQGLGDAGVTAPLWVVTRGAVAAGGGEVLASPVQAMVWGLGLAVAAEVPDRWGGLVDVPGVLDGGAGAGLCAVLAGCGEDQVAVRAAGVLGRRLVRAPLPGGLGSSGGGAGWVARGTVLVTGGTGAVGGHVARWVAGRGAARVVLASRSGPGAAGAAVLAAGVAGAGAAVVVAACDVGERGQVAGLVGRVGAGGPGLRVVVHAAGVLDDGIADGLDPARLAGVLAAKAGGAVVLDEVTAGLGLDAFVLFSSAAGVLGSAGQGNYGAANAFLDALAVRRAGRGLAGLSVAWGPWGGGGLAQGSAAARARLRRDRLPAMDPGLAVQALGQALAAGDTAVTVMDVDWARFASVPGAAQVPLLRDLPETGQFAPTADTGAAPFGQELAGRLAGRPRAEQDRVLTDLVRAEAAAVLGHPSAEAVGAGRAFKDLGFDSLTAVELRNRLCAVTGLRLPATLVWDYPTPVLAAEFLAAELLGAAAGERRGPGGGGGGGGGSGGGRGDGVPVPGRGAGSGGAVGAAGRGRGRDLGVPR